ncbi:MAG: hypothetical protein L0241_21590 [Planctomycetia bacterium]|nr:hypothetical protein [Planctomycetia bacterium]
MSKLTEPTRGFGLAIAGTILHMGLVLSLFVLYVMFVPAAKRTFDEFGLALPWLTQTVIRVSNWFAEYWWAMVPMILLLGVGNFVWLWWMSQHRRFIAVLWIAGVSAVLVALVMITIGAIELPLMNLKEGLAK